ncbi:MAG TPA: DNA polymerase III subunit gamma/tau, partial [Rhodothermales bacterium]|nr:DNA polymerase III subunit gamma/tau [Rhodothermales bacterium]
ELVGQEHVAETLRNALRLDRLAHAYLFSGPRGVGKTTAARLLAKAINCEVPLETRPDAEPCRQCDSCRAFEEGRSLNIIEIDAASNNKVDDIRELRDTVRVPPQGARRKVYIVDEVHMLSTSAFNALLKTLEEPPPYVLFIFATTEPHKVLPTILSRCQRFDFRRIAVEETVEHLKNIAVEEGIEADDASLLLIARKGDGALRDALSAFDQAVALCGTNLRYRELADALGVVDVDLYFEVSERVAARDAAGLLDLVDRLVRRGYDLAEFALGLQEHLRNLLVARTMPDTRLIEAAPAVQARYGDVAAAMTEADLLRQLTLVAEAETAMKASSQPRLRLELALARLAAMASAHDLNVALRAVERLEALAREGKLEAQGPRPESTAPSAQPPRGPVATTPPVHPGPAYPTQPVSRVSESAPKQDLAPLTSETRPAPASPAPAAAPTRSSDPSASDPAGLFSAPALRPRRPAPDAGPAAVAVLRTPDVEVVPQAGLGAVAAAWQALPGSLSGPRLAAVVREAVPQAVEGATLVLRVPSDLHGQMLGEVADTLLDALRPRVGDGLRFVRCVVRAPETTPMDPEDPQTLAQELRRTSEVARNIFDTFGGEVVY